MDERYLLAMQAYLNEAEQDLDQLASILKREGRLDHLLVKSAERVLQTTIEACIGIAKHWVKQKVHYTPVDAYDTFERLAQASVPIDLTYWKAVVGMRNALVHDYLKINPDILLKVFKEQSYRSLLTFARQALVELSA